MATADRRAYFEAELDRLYAAYPQLTVDKASLSDQWQICRTYTPQVLLLEHYYWVFKNDLPAEARFATILANTSWFLFEQGLPAEAMAILPTAQEIGEATMASGKLPLATIYRTLGGIYLHINKPRAALENFSRQLKILKIIGDSNDLVVAHGFTNLALAEIACEEYVSAREHLEKAEQIRSKYPSQAESYRAMTFDVKGIPEYLTGNYENAVGYLERAIVLYDRNNGVRNYLTAFANYTLGNVYISMGVMDEAFKLHTLALNVQKELLGDTYRTAASYHKVAQLLHDRGDDEGAEKLLLKAISIYEVIYEGKGGLGRSKYLLNLVLQKLGREQEARDALFFAKEIRQEILGIARGEVDRIESYDELVGILDR